MRTSTASALLAFCIMLRGGRAAGVSVDWAAIPVVGGGAGRSPSQSTLGTHANTVMEQPDRPHSMSVKGLWSSPTIMVQGTVRGTPGLAPRLNRRSTTDATTSTNTTMQATENQKDDGARDGNSPSRATDSTVKKRSKSSGLEYKCPEYEETLPCELCGGGMEFRDWNTLPHTNSITGTTKWIRTSRMGRCRGVCHVHLLLLLMSRPRPFPPVPPSPLLWPRPC